MNLSDGKKVYVQTQTAVDDTLPLSNDEIQECIDLTLRASALQLLLPFAVNVRVVDHNEGLRLNKQYKNENLPTNVLESTSIKECNYLSGNFSIIFLLPWK